MLLISLILAILLERFFPAPFGAIEDVLSNFLTTVKNKLNTGEKLTAIISWFSVTLLLGLIGWLLWLLCNLIHPILSLVFSIFILYLSFGFSNFINRFNNIQKCLKNGDLVDARKHLQDWANFVGADPVVFSTAKSGDSLSVTRETIRLGILAAQRNLFGVIFWYLVLPGPLGPIIYRVSVQAMKEWNDYTNNQQNLSDQENSTKKTEDPSNTKKTTADPIDSDNLRDIPDFFGEISKKGFFWVDWVSSRTTAFIFAIVGNFEDAIQMIRARSAMVSKQGYDSERIILSAGEGAMTLRLTIPVATSGFEDFENIRSTDYIVPDLREVDENSMRILTGLIWRALFLWFFVLMLITLGYLSNVLT